MVRGLGKQVRSLWRRIGKAGAPGRNATEPAEVRSLNPQRSLATVEWWDS